MLWCLHNITITLLVCIILGSCRISDSAKTFNHRWYPKPKPQDSTRKFGVSFILHDLNIMYICTSYPQAIPDISMLHAEIGNGLGMRLTMHTHSMFYSLTMIHIGISCSHTIHICTYMAHIKSQDVLIQCIAPAVVKDTATTPVVQIKNGLILP